MYASLQTMTQKHNDHAVQNMEIGTIERIEHDDNVRQKQSQKQYIKPVVVNDINITNWTKLCKFPVRDTNFSIVLYKNEFIASTWKDHDYKPHGLYRYNIINNEWIKWMDYPEDIDTSWHTMSLCREKHVIYIYNRQNSLIKINLMNNSCKVITNLLNTGNLPNSIWLNGKLNIIGGQNNNKHLIWNGRKKKFEIIHRFKEFEGITGFVLVHIKSKNLIALIGGTSFKPFSILDTIYLYFIEQQKWIKYEYKLPISMTNMSYIISSDDRYILLIAPIIDGYVGSIRTNKIYVVDTTNMDCKQSEIYLPFKPAPCHAISTQYNKQYHLLITGYIRKYNFYAYIQTFHEMEETTNWIQTIIHYYIKQNQYLYVIQDFEPSHYKINLLHIINGPFSSVQRF